VHALGFPNRSSFDVQRYSYDRGQLGQRIMAHRKALRQLLLNERRQRGPAYDHVATHMELVSSNAQSELAPMVNAYLSQVAVKIIDMMIAVHLPQRSGLPPGIAPGLSAISLCYLANAQ
jgi:hypothetical protein